jgi:spore maturation protein CgeB
LRIAVAGKAGSITHWLEDAAAAWRAEGHDVRLAITRRPWLAQGLEAALAGALAERLRASLGRFRPELIVVIGGYHTPLPLLEAMAAMPGRPPLVGWVGDAYEQEARAWAALYDCVGYTDSALAVRHAEWGFPGQSVYLPHAIDPSAAPAEGAFPSRDPRMVFVANPTPMRRETVAGIEQPMAIFGPGWRIGDAPAHSIYPGRVPAARAPQLYAAHRTALNIRNELHVLAGLNQRNFEPCLAGAALLTDAQGDLERCFEPGAEVLVWRDLAELNGHYARALADAAFAERVAAAGRARVLAHHTFAHRLAAITETVGLPKPGRRA